MTAPLVPSTLTHAALNALPAGSAVRCTTERGMRTVLALKLGGYGSDANKWLTTDGAMFPSSFAIAQADPVLLVPDSPVSKDPGTTLDNSGPDAGLRTALGNLAEGYESMYGGTEPRGAARDLRAQVVRDLRALLAAYPAPETDAVHFSAYGSPTSSCGLTKPRDEDGFTDRRALTTCAACRERFAPAPVSDTRREDVARALYIADANGQDEAFLLDVWNRTASQHVVRLHWYRIADAVLAVLPAPPVVDETVGAACAWSDYRKDYGVSADDRVRDLEHKAFMAGRQSALGTLDAGGVQR